jgi:hypothetical protein
MRVTSNPDAAAVWAIPLPIVPAPITTICFMGPLQTAAKPITLQQHEKRA